jgi:hypothetical protein
MIYKLNYISLIQNKFLEFILKFCTFLLNIISSKITIL